MPEEVKQIYHCDRCGALFKSTIKPVSELKCTACGMPPVRTRFAQLTDMPALDQTTLDIDHGVAGKDAADFVSMQRKAKKRRVMMVYAGCVVLLLAIGTASYVVKERNKNKGHERSLLTRGSWQFQERERDAAIASLQNFSKFAKATTGNSRAIHIIDGTDYLLDLKRYYGDPLNNIVKFESAAMVKYRLEEADGRKRLDARFEIREGKVLRKFEAVFWYQNEKWLLDWAQFVRIGEMPWGDFVDNPSVTIPQRFRLYVREPNAGSSVVGYTDLVFANPLNDINKPFDVARSVLVKDNTKLKQDILKHIAKTKKIDRDADYVIGKKDPVFMARVQVTIGYKMIKGEKRLVLMELHDKDWLATPKKK